MAEGNIGAPALLVPLQPTPALARPLTTCRPDWLLSAMDQIGRQILVMRLDYSLQFML
jgi:hypothetical protein